MKALPLEARTKNSRSQRLPERCRYCDDTGYVVAQTRTETWGRPVIVDGKREVKTTSAEVEEMGPCPFCERGYYEEFGDPDAQTKTPPVKPPWSLEEGFWKGREIADLKPVVGDQTPVSAGENARRAREMVGRIASGLKGMDE